MRSFIEVSFAIIPKSCYGRHESTKADRNGEGVGTACCMASETGQCNTMLARPRVVLEHSDDSPQIV